MHLPPMKTLVRREAPGSARFLTFSTYRRLPLFENDLIKDRFVEHLSSTAEVHASGVLAWVVMPEHVHLVLMPASQEVIPKLLSALKRPFARVVLNRWRALDARVLPKLRDRQGDVHFWQAGGGFDRNVIGQELLDKVRYCHKNPVERGLVRSPCEWQWSSARKYEQHADAVGPPIAFDLLPDTDRPLT